LFFNVLYDYFICYVTRACYKIATSPYMTTPKISVQALIFHHQFSGRFSFERLYQLTYRNVWRNRNKYMNMISRNMSLDNFCILGLTNFSDQISCSFSNFSTQNWLAVFGNPNNMVLQIINGMARFSIILHTASILKSSPKGEGFSPIPRVGQ
jgi:hypothetical protein